MRQSATIALSLITISLIPGEGVVIVKVFTLLAATFHAMIVAGEGRRRRR
jgi:hypothetical protein